MKELLEVIIKNLVDYPDEVIIEEAKDAKSNICYRVQVAPSDMGKVIGKHGRMAKAIRSVVRAVAIRENIMVAVEFLG